MSLGIPIYTPAGKLLSTETLQCDPKELINHSVVQDFLVMQRANARIAIAHTKTRGEVAGSGRKLYKQKGTGNARVGDKKSPIRRKGGVAFGPRNDRNFELSMNKKTKRLALVSALLMKIQEENVLGVKDYTLAKPQTKSAVHVMKDLKINDTKLLIVVPQEDKNIGLSLRNVERTQIVKVAYLNPYELLNATKVVFMNDTRTGLQALIDSCVSKHASAKKQAKIEKKSEKKPVKKAKPVATPKVAKAPVQEKKQAEKKPSASKTPAKTTKTTKKPSAPKKKPAKKDA